MRARPQSFLPLDRRSNPLLFDCPRHYLQCTPWNHLRDAYMVFFATRRARLRPQSASLYPEVAPAFGSAPVRPP